MITQLFLIRRKVLKHKYTERPQNTEHFWCLLLGYCIIFNKPSFLMPPTNLQFLFPNAKCLPMVLDFCPLTKTNAIPFFFIFYDGTLSLVELDLTLSSRDNLPMRSIMYIWSDSYCIFLRY